MAVPYFGSVLETIYSKLKELAVYDPAFRQGITIYESELKPDSITVVYELASDQQRLVESAEDDGSIGSGLQWEWEMRPSDSPEGPVIFLRWSQVKPRNRP